MTLPPHPEFIGERLNELSPIPEELKLFARVEHMVGEEARLLAEPVERRKQEQRERLRAIGEELDRIFETLRERAERLGKKRSWPATAS
jgi:hypothetical protein